MLERLADHPLPLIILIVLVVVLFGWQRLPDAARSLGRSAHILKSEVDDMKRETAERQHSTTTASAQSETGATSVSQDTVTDQSPHATTRE